MSFDKLNFDKLGFDKVRFDEMSFDVLRLNQIFVNKAITAVQKCSYISYVNLYLRTVHFEAKPGFMVKIGH
jgi:hypothetical protein